MISVKWAVACAERCLHFFEKERPNDNRPRLAIEAARQWIIDPIAAVYTVAYAADAADAVYADYAADYAAAAAALYAAAAANSADTAANAYAARTADTASADAARTAYDAAYYAAAAAAYAARTAYYAAYAAEQKWSRNKLKEIVGEYLNDYRRDLKNTLNVFVLTRVRVRVHIIPELSDIIINYVV